MHSRRDRAHSHTNSIYPFRSATVRIRMFCLSGLSCDSYDVLMIVAGYWGNQSPLAQAQFPVRSIASSTWFSIMGWGSWNTEDCMSLFLYRASGASPPWLPFKSCNLHAKPHTSHTLNQRPNCERARPDPQAEATNPTA